MHRRRVSSVQARFAAIIRLSVTDAGPGVPAAEREAVFDRYVRFDTGGRAGLGLTIAKTFVEAHGEHIWVEDVPGGGARLAFTLPRRTAWRRSGSDGGQGTRQMMTLGSLGPWPRGRRAATMSSPPPTASRESPRPP